MGIVNPMYNPDATDSKNMSQEDLALRKYYVTTKRYIYVTPTIHPLEKEIIRGPTNKNLMKGKSSAKRKRDTNPITRGQW